MLNTPVLFLIFNRPNETRQTFEQIKKVQPKQLFIAADGARANKPYEVQLCEETRKITENIDWECDVKRIYRDENWGCGKGVSTAITWFFEYVEEGIILEDDCLPDESFFSFCEELLIRYKKDLRIWQISGSNFFEPKQTESTESYFFSYYGSIWGWATWKDRWQYYDFNMQLYPKIRNSQFFYNLFGTKKEERFRQQIYDIVYAKTIDTWDYQWSFTKNINIGLAIVPNCNLITNIGFGNEGTHTKTSTDKRANLPYSQMKFPLHHPLCVIRDKEKDDFYFKEYCQDSTLSKLGRYQNRIIEFIQSIRK